MVQAASYACRAVVVAAIAVPTGAAQQSGRYVDEAGKVRVALSKQVMRLDANVAVNRMIVGAVRAGADRAS